MEAASRIVTSRKRGKLRWGKVLVFVEEDQTERLRQREGALGDLNDASLKNGTALEAGAAGSHSEVSCNQKHTVTQLHCYLNTRFLFN